MRQDRHIARDISYSYSAQTRSGRAMIRTMENLTGRIRLIKRAEGYEREVAEGRDFWQVMVERYGLTLDVIGGSLANIPREGPLVLIANHPYGILDGLMMGHILSQTRRDFRILGAPGVSQGGGPEPDHPADRLRGNEGGDGAEPADAAGGA